MLIVRRSDVDWQLAKCPLHKVDMWPMCESISFSEEDDNCVQHCIIKSNLDYQWYCTLVHCTVVTVQYNVYTIWLSLRLEFQVLVSNPYVKYIASTLPKIGQLDRLKTLEIVIFFRTYQYIHLLRLHPGIIISSTKQTSSFKNKICF